MSTSAPHANLLRLLLGALGATSACGAALIAPGCGAKVTVDSSTTTGGGGAGGQAQSSSSSSSGMPIDCKPNLVSTTMSAPPGTCGLDAGFFPLNFNCFVAPAAPATCAAYTEACILSTYTCGFSQGGMSIACGPVNEIQGQCCYVIEGDCAVGRPFTVSGRARLATLVPGAGWGASLAPDLSGLDRATRAALADAWGQEALFEHASIASFARFVMQLLALGAPADLVLAAQRALVEEHAHARTCFGLASAYAGVALAPGALPIEGGLDESGGATAIVESLAREGCVAETVAALQARRACDEARDPVVKAALEAIAAEETEHAALAWRALAWALERGSDAMRAAVARVFADAEAHVALGAVTHLVGDEAAMRAHGYLPVEERRALAREALGRVVGPAASALLGARRDQRAAVASAASMVSLR
jgi:hypothetical protein